MGLLRRIPKGQSQHKGKDHTYRYGGVLLLGLAVLGGIVAVDTTRSTLAVLFGAGHSGDWCSLSTYVDCRMVARSPYALVFDRPVAWFALGYYAWLICAAILLIVQRETSWLIEGLLPVALIAAAVSIWKLYQMIFLVGQLCIACLLLQGTNLLILGSILLMLRHFRPCFTRLATGISTLVPVMGVAGLLIEPVNQAAAPDSFEAITIQIPSDAPLWGNPKARTVVAVFSDFQCPFCSEASDVLRDELKDLTEIVQVRFIHFPLDPSVNPYVKGLGHKLAGRAAKTAIKAQDAGVFWAFHDALFNVPNLTEEKLRELTSMQGLDSVTEDSSAEQEMISDRLQRHIASGHEAGVRGTPTIFVNGRRLLDWRTPGTMRTAILNQHSASLEKPE